MLDSSLGKLRVATRSLDRDSDGFDGVYTLTVRATELNTRAYSETTVRITVTDENDESPRWGRHRYRVSVPENTAVGTKIALMRVQDRDEGLNGEMTVSVHPSHVASFSVTPALLRGTSDVSLILMAPLDYEDRSRVQLQIFANETQNADHFSIAHVIIDVINVNDNAPVFQKPLYSVNVPENSTMNSLVVSVKAFDKDEGVFGDITYSISDSSRNFGIDPLSGDILLLGRLDREDVYKYGILVSASDQGPSQFRATAAVTIHVTDVNDNLPRFDVASYTAYVTENEAMPKPIATVRAVDADSPPNNKITYDIKSSPSSNHFSITTSLEGLGLVYLKRPIDFESLYDGIIKLDILAIDSGVPPSNSTVPLVVTVTDKNDNEPTFLEDSTSNITIYENLGGGVLIGHVSALDLDEGANGQIRYYVEKGRKEFEKVFRLDELTGKLTVKPGSSPDREIMPYYDVIVVAEDKGNPPLFAKATVVISVLDVNDSPPKFEQEKYSATFREGFTSVLLTVAASDVDEEENATVRYSITEGDKGDVFAVGHVSGEVIAIKPLDYETSSGTYTLVITATDQVKKVEQRLTSTCQVVINVIDINDNSPVFIATSRNQPIVYDVIEGVEGPRVDRFTADDADAGKNAFVTYTICDGNEKSLFSISHSEGDLRVRAGQELDREEDEFHNLTICAKDSGDSPRTSKLSVVIRVTDTNDNAPTFVKFKSHVNVSENTRVGDAVAHIFAFDPDSGEFGKVTYSIASGNEEEAFVINKWNGNINLAKMLDRESVQEYALEIKAEDNPKSALDRRMTIKAMKVIVTDVNDETPRFVGSTPYRAQVDENSAPGTKVETLGDPIIASDADEGENAVVMYSIVNDDINFINNYVARHGGSFFSIDPRTAEISTQAVLDRESLASDVITLVVRASDRDRHHSDVNVLIQVKDVNDNTPRFRSERVRVIVKEDKQPGTEISSLLATDDDVGQNKKVTYRIKSGAYDKFTIEANTGVMRLAPGQFLDRENVPLYSVVVAAYDDGVVTSLSSTCVVTIEIEDVNDSRPKLDVIWQEVSVKENSLPGTVVAEVHASDADVSPHLKYSVVSILGVDAHGRPLVPGSHSRSLRRSPKSDYDIIKGWLTLNSTTGKITVSAAAKKGHSIDRELCLSVEMTISVRDLASVEEENAVALQPAVVKITIEDENDNSPRFVMTSSGGDVTQIDGDLIIDITEEAAIGTELLTVKAFDDDTGSNSQLVYDVIEGPKVQMRDQDSGTIIVASRIDRESLPHYGANAWVNITVLARDLGLPESRSAKLRIRMRVRDINDNSPTFNRRRYKVSVLENATVGSEIIAVKAKDTDSGSYGDLIYSLKGGRGTFGIHPVTGSVRLLSPLDREAMSKFELTATATDNERGMENDREEASVQLIILILDVNDCQPVFTEPKSPRTYSVQESSLPGTFVAVVSAKDDDDGGMTDITYSLLPSSVSKYFDIQESTGHITVRRRLASLPRHVGAPKLDVIASDSGGLSSNMTIYLDIVDANDHAPLFEEPRKKEISIFEEEPAGLLVGHVLATDSDSGLNGIVRYSFCDGKGADSFYIDEVTGRIITARRLDREKVSKYLLSICAKDLGLPSQSNSAPLTIKLLDRNDNKAEFPRSEDAENGEGAWQVVRVGEDFKVGSSIGMVARAVDRDLGENARIYYHLVAVRGPGAEQDMFSVEQESRKIILKRQLDREKVGRYSLIIKATNNGNMQPALPLADRSKKPVAMLKKKDRSDENGTYPAHLVMTSPGSSGNIVSIKDSLEQPEPLYDPAEDRSLIQVDVEILDVNDEWPRFLRREYDAAVQIKAEPETEIIKVKAVDGDAGDNSIVTYTIVNTVFRFVDGGERPVYSVFSLDPRDGTIGTVRPIENYVAGCFRLEVEARDSANHRATSVVNIYVIENNEKVKFIINNPPDIMRKQKDKFAEVLGNTTKLRVIVDNIQYHTRSDGNLNVGRSDVTVRAFDPKTRKEINSAEIQRKLEENEKILEKLFGEYSIREISPTSGGRLDTTDAESLRIVIIVMLIFLIIMVLVFSALYCHMQRRYKREIEALTAGALVQHGVKLTSRDALIPGTNVFSETGTNPIWRDDYFRHRDHKLSEDDTDSPSFGRTPVPLVRKARKSSDIPEAKPRSRSENDKLKEKSMPRTSTDVWVPHGQKLPVTSESLQQLMKERARKKRLQKKKVKERTQVEEKQKVTSSASVEGVLLSSKPSTTCVIHEEAKPKEKKFSKDKQSPVHYHGRHSPELSLHSGGPSEDIRKESLTLHASEVLEDDSDATATNVTSSPASVTSSTQQMASSISSLNLISDL